MSLLKGTTFFRSQRIVPSPTLRKGQQDLSINSVRVREVPKDEHLVHLSELARVRQFPFGVGATDEEQRKVELQRPSQGADVPLFLPSLLGQGIAVKSGFIDELVLVFPPASDSHSETTFRWRQMFRLLGVSPKTTGTAIATQFPHLVGFKRSLCLYFLYPLPHPLTTVPLCFNRC